MMYQEKTEANARDRYGYEQALDRVTDERQRIDSQVERLKNILAPVLESEIPVLDKAGQANSRPGYASALLEDINRHADNFSAVAERLESLIGRIRL